MSDRRTLGRTSAAGGDNYADVWLAERDARACPAASGSSVSLVRVHTSVCVHRRACVYVERGVYTEMVRTELACSVLSVRETCRRTETQCPLYVSASTRVRFSEKEEEEEEGGGLVNDVQENEEDEDEDEKEGKVITERERAPGCPRRVRPPLRPPSSCKILPVSPFLEHRPRGRFERDLACSAGCWSVRTEQISRDQPE